MERQNTGTAFIRLKIERKACAAFVLLALLLACTAALALDVLTPHSVAKIRAVTDVAISPDGARVAYVLSVPRQPWAGDEDGPGWAELHIVADGDSRGFVTGKVNVSQIAWTPDGKSLSFLQRRSGDRATSLYVIALEGGEARRIVAHDTTISAYSWSPDGKRVAFLATEPLPEATEKAREKGYSQEIYEEDRRFTRVWIADATNDNAKPRMLDLPGNASRLSWSPAGPWLALALAPTPLVDDELMRRKVHVVDAESGRITAKIENPGKLGDVVWSPDGKHLALISAADLNDPAEGRLMVVSASGGPLRDLLPNYTGHVAAIAWQDADTVMFIGDEGVRTIFDRVDIDGSNRGTILAGGGPVFTALSLSDDGVSAAFIGQSPAHPAEVFRAKHPDTSARRATNSNPWLADVRLAPQEVVKYKARDGLELEGLLIRPLGETKGQRYPLILVVHGGPEAHYRNGWLTSYSSPGQMAAARGFAVFYPNYRGSTGRGLAFSKLSQGDPAGKEFDDCVDAVDHLINTGLVDRAKVGITGGSYGGYASGWGATFYSERFAAAVMFVGISDKLSKVGTTDITEEEYLVHARHRPWENWQLFLERSPIYHAGKSKTPTPIAGGLSDERVHPSQSMEMYRHLKLRGSAPVRLVRYPGEPHGNRRAASRLDYSLRLMQWFEHYLKGPGGPPPAFEIDYAEPK
jgi:dipeptidyl aminopeptidase/acylaminoacyl peptidase